MILDSLRTVAIRRPIWVVGFWVTAALTVGLLAPNLTKLAAEGQANLLTAKASESLRAAIEVGRAWPDQFYESMAIVALHRPGGLTGEDRAFALRLGDRLAGSDRPDVVLRVIGPRSDREIAERLVSRDGTVQLLAIHFDKSFVSPATQRAVAWMETLSASQALAAPEGLEVRWSGDAVIGLNFMANVQTSLDRAAIATVFLLLIVLLVVYRSIWLALVPLATIGASLVIARGILAWMAQRGWEISPLVELFLVAILFGSGTDFCLFLSWRYGEHWNADNPAEEMKLTLDRAIVPLLTSAGTVIVGLLLMGTTRFKLFSCTGPSVAIGLVLSLAATLTLTPALLLLLARIHPRSFQGLSAPSSGFWERISGKALSRPLLSWGLTLLAMSPLALLGLRTTIVHDIVTELPADDEAAGTLRLVADKFAPGILTPLTVVLDWEGDFRQSEGLALIDDVSRFLSHQRRLGEIRSATQPLGSPKPLARARIASRLGEVNDGFARLKEGAGQLRKGLNEGIMKLRAALWLERQTGLNLTGFTPGAADPAAREALSSGLKQASLALLGSGLSSTEKSTAPSPSSATGRAEDPRETMVRELTRAAEGAGEIAEGAEFARHEVSSILSDPVGRRALDRLLINAETVQANPDLLRSFAIYITEDGHHARIELAQADRVFSAPAMDQVETLRHRLNEYLGDLEGMTVQARITGPNAHAADVRNLTRSDQFQSWFIVPIGVFLVLVLFLRDPLACVNLVVTMLLTYVFTLGTTHLVFVTILGAEGIDWKVPYFLFVLLVAVGVDYNVFLMDRVRQETKHRGMRSGIIRAVGQTGGLITSAAAITACSFASFLSSPLISLRQLGFALVVGIVVDAVLVRPLLVPCGHWLLNRRVARQARESRRPIPVNLCVSVAD
jgi:RND superfamily putative drug exporter